jgi:hypothetical protein
MVILPCKEGKLICSFKFIKTTLPRGSVMAGRRDHYSYMIGRT